MRMIKKIQLGLIVGLGMTACVLAKQVYYKWNLLMEQEQQKTVAISRPVDKQQTQQADSKQQHKKKDIPFEQDKKWAMAYAKDGDRTRRYPYNVHLPVFKREYNSWTGKSYIEKSKLEQVTTAIIARLPHIKDDKNVVSLIVETAIAESSGGYFTSSVNGDYGVFQIRKEVAEETLQWLKDCHKDVYNITVKFQNKKLSLEENLAKNIPFGIALCASEYWRKAGPNFTKHIKTQKDRAIMWKSVYNTRKGLGTVEAYIKRNAVYETIVAQRSQKQS